MQRTSGRGIVEQQHTGDDVFRLHGARDGRVRNKVLRGALEGEMEMIRSASPSRSHLIANFGSAHFYRHLQRLIKWTDQTGYAEQQRIRWWHVDESIVVVASVCDSRSFYGQLE